MKEKMTRESWRWLTGPSELNWTAVLFEGEKSGTPSRAKRAGPRRNIYFVLCLFVKIQAISSIRPPRPSVNYLANVHRRSVSDTGTGTHEQSLPAPIDQEHTTIYDTRMIIAKQRTRANRLPVDGESSHADSPGTTPSGHE
jgi:hypothetical protein